MAMERPRSDELSAEVVDNICTAFEIWDKEQQGAIPWSDFPSVWRSLGQNPNDADIQAIVKDPEFGDKGTGYFDAEALVKLAEQDKYYKDNVRVEELIEAFRAFDKDGREILTQAQFRHMIQCCGDKLDAEEADSLVAKALNPAWNTEDGDIEYVKFVMGGERENGEKVDGFLSMDVVP
eukprot:TRINITY_DN47305_c0_g1_i1.p1 TRINITY_DN47305_c0_g1~~TRINITY_DN47305_c0_g1_i1.p1  ORF type:complete len:203 (+),score=48.26 TRINITY_DN47305_c0_g1_i1:74-610(+)